MKKIRLLLFISLFLLAGCKEGKSALSPLTAVEETQLWHRERRKSFGVYDYKNISETQAKQLLKEKFQLDGLDFYEEAKKRINQANVTKGQKKVKETYDVIVNDVRVTFLATSEFEREGQPTLKMLIELDYLFDSGEKRVALDRQTLMIQNQSEKESSLLLNEIPVLSKQMAEVIKVANVEKGLANYSERYAETKGNLPQQTIAIWENSKEAYEKKSVLKSIQVFFDAESVAREFYVNISDKTNG